MDDGVLLLPNVGAEEGPHWRRLRRAAPVATTADLWRLLFPADARLAGDDLGPDPEPPEWLRDERTAPAFAWLPASSALAAWLNTEEAARAARAHGRALYGAPPRVVTRVHDKAFAAAAAERLGLVPPALRGCSARLDPAELEDPGAAARRIERELADWPAWARERFALKPRLGTSGRGRAAGANGRADTPELEGAFARLAARGGALLEPWLERAADLSAQLHVAADGALTLVGTTRQLLTPSGVYRGHVGWIDGRGRVSSGHPHDEALREAAVSVATAAAEAGYAGPCGLDSLVFRDPAGAEVLRPVVELNARFSVGTLALGLLRRALPRVRARTRLAGGERLAFCFRLDAPPGGWPESDTGLLVLPLATRPGPALAVAPSLERLGTALADLAPDLASARGAARA